jgi:hypothetical protein
MQGKPIIPETTHQERIAADSIANDKKERMDEEDRKSEALPRLEKAKSQTAEKDNAGTDTSPGSGDVHDGIAIVLDITHDHRRGRRAVEVTGNYRIVKACRTKNKEPIGGISLQK